MQNHFEFIFVYGVRKYSSFILLQVVDQFSQASPVKEIVFSPLYILASFVEDKVPIGVWIYLWAFYFVPLIYISVFVPVPYCLEEGRSGWGTHVHPWQIYVNVWQNQCNIVK